MDAGVPTLPAPVLLPWRSGALADSMWFSSIGNLISMEDRMVRDDESSLTSGIRFACSRRLELISAPLKFFYVLGSQGVVQIAHVIL